MLIRIEAKHFVAGVVVEGRYVTRAAPILKYMVGWAKFKVMGYARRKGWRASSLEE